MSIPVLQKARRALEILAERSTHPGAMALFDVSTDYPLIDAVTPAEAQFVLIHLEDAGLLTNGGMVVTVRGWTELEPKDFTAVPGTCFVAMSFDPTLDTAYDDGILPALEHDCGYRVLRVDRVEHNDEITDRIIAGIRSAQFVVSDFTKQRQGVYYEAGFARGLGKVVISTCRKDDLELLHFDTRQHSHVVWKDPLELREKLALRVQATVGKRRTQ
jgi:hypothetical protein